MATIATRKNRWPVALAAVLVVYLTAAGLLFPFCRPRTARPTGSPR